VRVLLVEDNDILRKAIKEALELHSFEVHEARSGRDALATIEGQTERFDVVISDLVMPNMNALELYEALERIQVGVKMLIITGYPMPTAGQTLTERPGVAWIQKPVRFQQLGTLVRQLSQVGREAAEGDQPARARQGEE